MAKRESDFKRKLYNEIREKFPGSEVLPNDAGYRQGIPDATVYLPNGRYIMLESKRVRTSSRRPNQEHYVEKSSFSNHAMFAYPENKNEVLSEVEKRYKMK